MKKYEVTWPEIKTRVESFKRKYKDAKVYGIPRGGQPVAAIIGNPVDTPEEADVLVDDVWETGRTAMVYIDKYKKPFWTLFNKTLNQEIKDYWLIFPWEKGSETGPEENIIRIIEYMGDDPKREGLVETPARYIKFLKEFITVDPVKFTTFQDEGYDEMIIQRNIPFYSLCEHHIAPFFGTGNIAYIPNGKIVGLSKLARALDFFSHRLQNQERITKQVAEKLEQVLNPKGVAVSLTARHMCMEMRGVKKHDTYTTTTFLTGRFQSDHKTRAEFMELIK